MDKFDHKSGQFVKIDDALIYVEEKGSRDAYPIIFLHGGFGTIEDFNGFIELLPKNFRSVGIDTRGHGKSTLGSQPLNYELLENDVIFILGALNINNCCVIGFSDGGIVAYRLAIKRHDLIAKIVTIGADWNPPAADLRARFSSLTPEIWTKKFPASVELYNRLNQQADFNRLLQNIIKMWLDQSHHGYPQDDLKKICCEALIVRGDDDHLMPRAVLTTLEQTLSSAKLLNVPFAGHLAHIDQKEIVSMIVRQFIAPLLKI
jgi:pimeloyl-ACP methyl ester carboxylesterase